MKYTAMTLEHIVEDCGFGSYPYFHRVFHKKYDLAPGHTGVSNSYFWNPSLKKSKDEECNFLDLHSFLIVLGSTKFGR
jgi:AraC-like DNA-binding protein